MEERKQKMTDRENMTPQPQNTELTEIELLFDDVEKGAVGKADKRLSRGKVSTDCRNEKGVTPLIKASAAGNASFVGMLIRHKADVNAVDTHGYTPLQAAASNGHIEVVQLLVSNGADLEIRNKENLTASEVAKEMGFPEIVTYLSVQQASSSTGTETSEDPDDDGPTTDSAAGASLSFAPEDDGHPTAGSAGAAAGAAMIAAPESQAYVRELDLEQIPEPGRAAYFEPYKGPDAAAGDRQQGAEEALVEDKADPVTATKPGTEEAFATVTRAVEDTTGKTRVTRPAIPEDMIAANEERIEFDALDNKQVRNINEKIKKVLDKASFEVGDYVIDTVFKGSYMAVLKPRSQENKRWRKLKKHPHWIYDPRRLTELTGGCATRRLCLAEGVEVSSFSISHFIELYNAKDLKMILTLAEEASTNKYTVRELKMAVDDLREHKDDHDPGKEIIKTLDQPVPILEDPDLMALCTDRDRVIKELSKTERKRIRALIKARKPGLDDWKSLMDTLEGILSDLGEG